MINYGYTSAKELDILDKRAREHRALKNYRIDKEGPWFESECQIDLEIFSEKGLITCPNFLVDHRKTLKQMAEKFEELVARKIELSRVKNVLQENPYKTRNGTFSYISQGQLEDPNFKLKRQASIVSVANPFLVFPNLADIVLHKKILDAAVAYFQAMPMLSYVKITQSFANNLPDFDTQYWHFDSGAKKIFKVLIYLNDVDREGGPFSYVTTSNSKRFRGWNLKSRFTDMDVVKNYTEGNMYVCEGKVGDVIFAETTGLHKGLKPISSDRSILIFNFTMHPEVGFPWGKIIIPRDVVSSLTSYQRLFLTDDVFHCM